MKDNNTQNYNNGTVNNTNTDNSVNDSYNQTTIINNYNMPNSFKSSPANSLNNSNNRTKLKNMVGQEIRIWGFAVREYRKTKNKKGEPIVRYTVTNIHDKFDYIADHIQLNIAEENYNEDICKKLIKVNGVVEEYETGGFIKQSIYSSNVEISDMNSFILNTDHFPQINTIYNEYEFENRSDTLCEFDSNKKYKLLMNSVDLLNDIIRLPRNFITDYIVNHYMINYDPESMNRGNYELLQNDDDSICEIMTIILSTVYNICIGEIKTIWGIMEHVNQILNSIHGLKEGDNPSNYTRKIKGYEVAPKRFKNFCKKHNLKINPAYDFIRTRNHNYYYGIYDKNKAYCEALEILFPIESNFKYIN